jgi:hypothetical protein
MPTEIKTKKTFGTLDIARISPEPKADSPRALNIHLSFDFGLGLRGCAEHIKSL